MCILTDFLKGSPDIGFCFTCRVDKFVSVHFLGQLSFIYISYLVVTGISTVCFETASVKTLNNYTNFPESS
jgi:hypothetical protein